MDDREVQWIGLSILCTGCIFLITLPTAWRLRWALSRVKATGQIFLPDVYRDQDGAATEESLAAFSDRIPKIAIYVSTILGFSAACASAVLSTASQTPIFSKGTLTVVSWLNVGAWVCANH